MDTPRQSLEDLDVACCCAAIVAIVGVCCDSRNDSVDVKVENPVINVESCGRRVEKRRELLHRDDGRR